VLDSNKYIVRLEASICCDNDICARILKEGATKNKDSLDLDLLHDTPVCLSFLVSRGKGRILYSCIMLSEADP